MTAPVSDRHACDFRITLLGTGGPELSVDRLGSATLVEAGSEVLLIDAGRGVLQRLFECGVRLNGITKILFTHLHSDHVEGLPNLWITPWFLLGRKVPMQLWGPVGTRRMAAGMREFLAFDVENRVEDDSPAEALAVTAHEFSGEGVVYAQNGLVVTSVPVDHKDGNPAFGFILEYGGRKVVLSGDCTYSHELATRGEGADVVIHNVLAPSPALLAREPHKRKVAEKLASPEQAAAVFARTGTKLAVYTHVIRLDSTDAQIIARTRAAGYAGPLVIGQDRMIIEVGDTPIVREPASTATVADVTSREHA